MSNATSCTFPSIENLDRYDLFRMGAITLAFGASVSTQKNWLRAESLLCMITGAFSILVPTFMARVRSPTDPTFMQIHLSQIISAAIFSQALSSWRVWRHSRDDTVLSTILWSQLLRVSLALVVSAYYAANLNAEHTYFLGLILSLVWFGSAFHLCVNGYDNNRHVKNTAIHWVLRADSLLLFLAGVMHFCFPEWVMDINNKIVSAPLEAGPFTYFLIRSSGAIAIGMGVIPLSATLFRFDDDKNEVFKSRLLGVVIMLLVSIHSKYMIGATLMETLRDVGLMGVTLGLIPVIGLMLMCRKKQGESEGQYVHYTRSRGKVE